MRYFYLMLIFSLIISPVWAKSAQGSVARGNKHYRKGEYKSARENYEAARELKPQDEIVNFNCGTAAYKEGDYKAAKDYFLKSLVAQKGKLSNDAAYNLGNSSFKQALSLEESALEQAVSEMAQAVKRFDGVRKVEPKNTDVQYNYEVSEKELKRLKEKLKKQEEQKQKQQQDKQQDKEQKKQEDEQQAPQQKNEQNKEHEGEQEQPEQKQNNDEPREPQQKPPTSPGENKEDLSQKEAMSLLNEYREEEPKELYKEKHEAGGEKPVDKDW